MKLPPSPQLHLLGFAFVAIQIFQVRMHLPRRKIAVHLASHKDSDPVAIDPDVGNAVVCFVHVRENMQIDLQLEMPKSTRHRLFLARPVRLPCIWNAHFNKKGAAHPSAPRDKVLTSPS
jgi:hypothetical protein